MIIIDDILSIKGLLFKITDYLDLFDIIKFRKIKKKIYSDIFNKSDYLFRNLSSYYNILVTENKTSINFRKENFGVSIQKSNIKNYFEKCLYLSRLYHTPTTHLSN
jgi:hypothetical protein